MARQKVSNEVRAAALADLANGEQPVIVAQRYGVNRQTVKAWKARMGTDLQPGMQPVSRNVQPEASVIRRPSIEEHQTKILDLMYQNLAAKLTASQRLAEHVIDTDWLHRQSAEGVAALGTYLDATATNTLAILAGRRPDSPDD